MENFQSVIYRVRTVVSPSRWNIMRYGVRAHRGSGDLLRLAASAREMGAGLDPIE
ncbi:hypothetical protein IG631_03798 [Alternaria alternata]|nr:hypothetical protein IG631_03798 [Alternaria alternata]